MSSMPGYILYRRKHKKLLEVDESVLSENERMIVKMNMLLDNTKRWCDSDLEKAMQSYTELMSLYDSLNNERKKAYYKPVHELYTMLRAKAGIKIGKP